VKSAAVRDCHEDTYAPRRVRLQRLQELDDGLPIFALQLFEFLTYMACFATVPQNGVG
jgi:hypothetical protein